MVPPTDYECLPRRPATSGPAPQIETAPVVSPDKSWEAIVQNHNVAIRRTGGGDLRLRDHRRHHRLCLSARFDPVGKGLPIALGVPSARRRLARARPDGQRQEAHCQGSVARAVKLSTLFRGAGVSTT